jgi:hypothetical protein
MSKSVKKQLTASSTAAAPARKPARQPVGDPKTKKPDRASKQAHVIAMLQSPKGYRDRSDDEGHGLAATLGARFLGWSCA